MNSLLIILKNTIVGNNQWQIVNPLNKRLILSLFEVKIRRIMLFAIRTRIYFSPIGRHLRKKFNNQRFKIIHYDYKYPWKSIKKEN